MERHTMFMNWKTQYGAIIFKGKGARITEKKMKKRNKIDGIT